MLRKSITYKNFAGKEVTEEHHFHMTKAELIKAEVSEKDGLREKLLRVVASGDAGQILATFEDIIRRSYGIRLDDDRFVKREADWEIFVSSEAYSALFMELVTNANFAAEFVRGIMPDDIDEATIAAAAQASNLELPQPSEPDNRPAWLREDREPTDKELQSMSKEELVLAMRWKSGQRAG